MINDHANWSANVIPLIELVQYDRHVPDPTPTGLWDVYNSTAQMLTERNLNPITLIAFRPYLLFSRSMTGDRCIGYKFEARGVFKLKLWLNSRTTALATHPRLAVLPTGAGGRDEPKQPSNSRLQSTDEPSVSAHNRKSAGATLPIKIQGRSILKKNN